MCVRVFCEAVNRPHVFAQIEKSGVGVKKTTKKNTGSHMPIRVTHTCSRSWHCICWLTHSCTAYTRKHTCHTLHSSLSPLLWCDVGMRERASAWKNAHARVCQHGRSDENRWSDLCAQASERCFVFCFFCFFAPRLCLSRLYVLQARVGNTSGAEINSWCACVRACSLVCLCAFVWFLTGPCRR